MSPNIFLHSTRRPQTVCTDSNTKKLSRKRLREAEEELDKQLYISNKKAQKLWLMIDKHLSPNGELLHLDL